MIKPKSNTEIKLLKTAGHITALILKKISSAAQPGTTTKELNALANELCRQYKVKPAFLGFNGFPACICTSVNSAIVHGIPSNIPLKNGDILGLDFGAIYHGYCADCATTIPIGRISLEAKRLISATRDALAAAEKVLRDNVRIGDIGAAIAQVAQINHLGIVKELTGHGIGRKLQEDPSIPNYGKPNTGIILREGMTIAIEPMFTLGSPKIISSPDGWTIKTSDSSLSAHFEHTVLITKTACRILTPID